jgi:hypothetical protein
MATYYVDYVGGADTNNGTATSTPWKHCPGDSNATGNADITVSAGDKIIFKGGVKYIGGVTCDASGNADTLAGRIHYDGDSGTYVTRWGSGTSKAEIDCNDIYIGFTVANRAYLTINNFGIHNGIPTGNADSLDDSLIYGGEGSSFVTISNCQLYDVGHKTASGDYSGVGVGTYDFNDWRIHDNTFTNCYNSSIFCRPQYSPSQNNLYIYNNTITDVTGWAIAIPVEVTADCDNWNIYNNTIYNIKFYSENVWENPHANYIWIYHNGDGKTVSNVNIYNNFIYNDGTPYESSGCIHFEITGPDTHFENIRIYNNVIHNVDYAIAIYFTFYNTGSYDGVYIYGNTIRQDTGHGFQGGAIGLIGNGAGRYYTDVYIKNNIISSTFGSSVAISLYKNMITNLNIDYNLYQETNASAFQSDGNTFQSWAAFKTATGQSETHSIGITSDPLFTDIEEHNFRLSSESSPAHDTGANLGSPYNIDMDNISRPSGGAWDMGAYEYGQPGTIIPMSQSIGLRF